MTQATATSLNHRKTSIQHTPPKRDGPTFVVTDRFPSLAPPSLCPRLVLAIFPPQTRKQGPGGCAHPTSTSSNPPRT